MLKAAYFSPKDASKMEVTYGEIIFNPSQLPFNKGLIAFNNDKLCYLGFEQTGDPSRLHSYWPKAKLSIFSSTQEEIIQKISFDMQRIGHNSHNLKIHLSGTEFQLKVWQELLKMVEIISYSELAIRINKPQSVRAVASAVGRNPISFVIPCHKISHKKSPKQRQERYHWGAEIKNYFLGINQS